MTGTDLATMLDEAEVIARDSMEGSGQISPMLLCEKDDGERFIVVYQTAPTAMQRRFVALQMGKMLRERGVVRFVVIGEAWYAFVDSLNEENAPPSKRSDRREAVFLEAHGNDADVSECRFFDIDRSGQTVRLIQGDDLVDKFTGITWEGILLPRAANDP